MTQWTDQILHIFNKTASFPFNANEIEKNVMFIW